MPHHRGKRSRSLLLACFTVTALSSLAPVAGAQPEITGNLALGGGVVYSDDPHIQGHFDERQSVVRLGLNGSVTFLRESNHEVGLGLYAEVMTSSFHDVMPGLGMTLLLPIHHGAPLIIWAGMHYRYDGDHAGGVGGRLWWGAHNHNYYRLYNATFGLWVELRADLFGDSRQLLVAGGVDIDLETLVVPWLWLASLLRGPGRL